MSFPLLLGEGELEHFFLTLELSCFFLWSDTKYGFILWKAAPFIAYPQFYLFFFNFIYLFICLFIYGCVGSSFLCEGFL